MNILYLGHFFPQNLIRSIVDDSKGLIGFSNHNFEMSIMGGLVKQGNVDLRVISIPSVYSYPYNNRRLFTRKEVYQYNNTLIRSIGFCNLPIIKELGATLACAFRILQVLKSFKDGKINVIINTPSRRLIDALKIVRFISKKQISQTVIVPDIPSMVSDMDKSNLIKRWLLKRRDKRVMSLTSHSDGLVVLTDAMIDLFAPKPKHIVMEGIVDLNNMDLIQPQPNAENEIILYTGTLRRIFGVLNLVEAFKMIPNDNIQLWICGSGEASNDIRLAAESDQRIKFFGLVDSSKALELQREATILVNPRTSDGVFTKYSFPSKTMEYLLAGKSTIINKLPGIPEEYYNYVYTPEDESIEMLAKCIQKVINTDPKTRERNANEGRKFILEQKNSKVQVGRIIDLIVSYN